MASDSHHLIQRTKAWHEARLNRIGGSEVGAFVGLSSYDSPIDAINKKIKGITSFEETGQLLKQHSDQTQLYFDHGSQYEMASLMKFFEWMAETHPDFSQQYKIPPGWHTPSIVNPNFDDDTAERWFSVSLDGEGSEIDVEIKNPYSMQSFFHNYQRKIKPENLAQCMWAMAIRDRPHMYFMATHFDPQDQGKFKGMVIWYVQFNEEFFKEYILKPISLVIPHIAKRAPISMSSDFRTVPKWINHGKQFENSDVYQHILSHYCKRVYSFSEKK